MKHKDITAHRPAPALPGFGPRCSHRIECVGLCVGILTLLLSSRPVPAQEPAPSNAPLRIVAFGDSTTAPRGSLPVYANILRRTLPEKGLHAEVINAGIGGNTTAAARRRLQKDVLDRQPTLTIIQFGINDSAIDVWKTPPVTAERVPLPRYIENLQFFIDRLQAQGSAVILMTPNPLQWTPRLKTMYGHPPYDPSDPDGFNLALCNYAEAVRNIARTNGLPLVDIDHAFRKYAAEPNHSLNDLLSDGMHPNARGQALVAEHLIDGITTHFHHTQQE